MNRELALAPITLEEFREELRRTGRYDSHPEHLAPVRTQPGAWTTFRFTVATTIVFPLCGIAEMQGRLDTLLWSRYCFRTVQCAESLGVPVHFEGFENRMAYEGPVVYVSNHMSTLETVMLPFTVLTFGPFNIVAKASLTHLPFLTKAAAHMGLVPISRVSPREDLMNMFRIATESIEAGRSFMIFPQGTRQEVCARKHFGSIGAKIAEKAGCPIVPIAIDTRIMPTRKAGALRHVFKDFGPVDTSRDIRIACGPVIPCGKSKAMHEATFDWIANKLEEWGVPTEK